MFWKNTRLDSSARFQKRNVTLYIDSPSSACYWEILVTTIKCICRILVYRSRLIKIWNILLALLKLFALTVVTKVDWNAHGALEFDLYFFILQSSIIIVDDSLSSSFMNHFVELLSDVVFLEILWYILNIIPKEILSLITTFSTPVTLVTRPDGNMYT